MELWNFTFDLTQNHVLLVLGVFFAIGLSWGRALMGLPLEGFAFAGIFFIPAVLFIILFNEAISAWHGIDLLELCNIHIESWGKWNTGDLFPLDFSLKVWKI